MNEWLDSVLLTVQPIEIVWLLLGLPAYWDLKLEACRRADNAQRDQDGRNGPARTQGTIDVWLCRLCVGMKISLASAAIPALFLEQRAAVEPTPGLAAVIAGYYSPIAFVGCLLCMLGLTVLLWTGYNRVGEAIEAEEAAKAVTATAVSDERARVEDLARRDAAHAEVAVTGERERVADKAAIHAEGVAEGAATVAPAHVKNDSTEAIADAVTEAIKADTTQIKSDTAEILEVSKHIEGDP